MSTKKTSRGKAPVTAGEPIAAPSAAASAAPGTPQAAPRPTRGGNAARIRRGRGGRRAPRGGPRRPAPAGVKRREAAHATAEDEPVASWDGVEHDGGAACDACCPVVEQFPGDNQDLDLLGFLDALLGDTAAAAAFAGWLAERGDPRADDVRELAVELGADFPYSLTGELDKNGLQLIRGAHKPDFLVHIPMQMDNLLIVEVKQARPFWTQMANDLRKLAYFRRRLVDRTCPATHVAG